MIKSEYNYRYDIQVKINCEHCDNSFVRHDVLKTTYPETKEGLEEMYENSCEGLSEEEMKCIENLKNGVISDISYIDDTNKKILKRINKEI